MIDRELFLTLATKHLRKLARQLTKLEKRDLEEPRLTRTRRVDELIVEIGYVAGAIEDAEVAA